MPQFIHRELRLLNPRFSSPLLDVLTDLEHLRRLEIKATTPPSVFQQLKQVFHFLESLASARIEGNHTTLADYIETKVAAPSADAPADSIKEVVNIERAMEQVEQAVTPGAPIGNHLIRGLHATAVHALVREGDATPGAYRTGPLRIAKSDHAPPDAIQVPGYMEELVGFVNREDQKKYDLMKVALAHHRFAWIHPFGNGNGRVVRLFTYALLIKYGFRVSAEDGRLLNPAAVFCADREKYYDMLAKADAGSDEDLEAWCTYVLTGIRDELSKVDRLADYDNLTSEILVPALTHARQRQLVTPQEERILLAAIKGKVVKSGDLTDAMPGLTGAQRTYQIRRLVGNGMLQPIYSDARQYTIGFSSNMLLRGVVRALTDGGFISSALAADGAS
ncbi:Fic family protein [Ideonella azotifigens]|uniref:Fic family protein n=2 Tax=Ideonella azotifigens TaxID=513160 RepID=A0ABN1KDT5_9BURK|nr:Fic family protein [Ideonella azotifigens]MCD2344526.1 Fic family protein [Ideonella azotifigens]